jgi:valyl-tRNA synthetase
LHDTIVAVSDHFDGFDFGNAADAIWRFVWYEFCDWYVEATKVPENHGTRAAVLSFVWNNAMRLLHPIAPFISEEVWLALPHDGVTIMTATWPDRLEVRVDREAAAAFETQMAASEEIRRQKAALELPLSSRPATRVPGDLSQAALGAISTYSPPISGSTIQIDVNLRGGISGIAVEAPATLLLERYRKDAVRLRREVERSEKTLANRDFTAKAAPNVVAKEREKLEGYRNELARVEKALAAMGETA